MAGESTRKPLTVPVPRFELPSEGLVNAWWLKFLEAMAKANKALDRLEQRIAYLREYCAINNYTESNQRERIMQDWVRMDAVDDWTLYCAEAKRYKDAIDCVAKMHELTTNVYRKD